MFWWGFSIIWRLMLCKYFVFVGIKGPIDPWWLCTLSLIWWEMTCKIDLWHISDWNWDETLVCVRIIHLWEVILCSNASSVSSYFFRNKMWIDLNLIFGSMNPNSHTKKLVRLLASVPIVVAGYMFIKEFVSTETWVT